MSAGWVAASVRARAMGHRRLGPTGARALAGSSSYREAVESLARSPYADRVHPTDDLSEASHGIAATVLWNLRVLAGWVPPDGTEMLRALAAWFEIANVEQHLRGLAGRPAEPPFALGSLATAWPRLAASNSVDELSTALATSAWGPPSGPTPHDVELSLRLSWGQRVAARIPAARPWTVGAVALLLARERFARGEALPVATLDAAGRVVGVQAATAGSLAELHRSLPRDGRWVLEGVSDADGLWRAESLWWRRLGSDSSRLLARSTFGADHVIGAVGMLAADARLVIGSLALAGRGPGSTEVFDELA